jgi:SAM-dependent methyltransferase
VLQRSISLYTDSSMPDDNEKTEVEPIPIADINASLRYKHDSLLDDLSAEYADYSGLPLHDVRELLKANGSEPEIPEDLFGDEDRFLLGLLSAELSLPHLRGRTQLALSLAKTLPVRTYLDYGAGLGRDCIAFSRFGYECFHADLLGRQTEFAAWRYQVRRLRVRIGDVRELPDEKFDVVSCYDVLEHVPDPVGVLVDLAWHVAPGGLLLIAVDLYNWAPPHLPKNNIYGPFWGRILEVAGLTFAGGSPSPILAAASADIQVYHRDQGGESVTKEELAERCFRDALAHLEVQRDYHDLEIEMIRATLDYIRELSVVPRPRSRRK